MNIGHIIDPDLIEQFPQYKNQKNPYYPGRNIRVSFCGYFEQKDGTPGFIAQGNTPREYYRDHPNDFFSKPSFENGIEICAKCKELWMKKFVIE